MSLILVIINIVVIFLAAILVFYLKEAIPLPGEVAAWKAATNVIRDIPDGKDVEFSRRNRSSSNEGESKHTENGYSRASQSNDEFKAFSL